MEEEEVSWRQVLCEYLITAASFEAQKAWEQRAQFDYAAEFADMWGDIVRVEALDADHYKEFSDAEKDAIRAFDTELDRAYADLPQPIPDLAELQTLPAYERLRQEAERLLALLDRSDRP